MRVAVLATVLLTAAHAWAQAPEARQRAKLHFKQGKAYQEAGAYREAIAEYEAAYALSPLPELRFNIGQCLRLGGDGEGALVAYRQYLDAVPEGALADEAREHVARLVAARGAGPSSGPVDEWSAGVVEQRAREAAREAEMARRTGFRRRLRVGIAAGGDVHVWHKKPGLYSLLPGVTARKALTRLVEGQAELLASFSTGEVLVGIEASALFRPLGPPSHLVVGPFLRLAVPVSTWEVCEYEICLYPDSLPRLHFGATVAYLLGPREELFVGARYTIDAHNAFFADSMYAGLHVGYLFL